MKIVTPRASLILTVLQLLFSQKKKSVKALQDEEGKKITFTTPKECTMPKEKKKVKNRKEKDC